jgi:hypothetical protein
VFEEDRGDAKLELPLWVRFGNPKLEWDPADLLRRSLRQGARNVDEKPDSRHFAFQGGLIGLSDFQIEGEPNENIRWAIEN